MQLRKPTEKITIYNAVQTELEALNKKLDKVLTALQKQKVSTGGCATTDDINKIKKGE